MPCQRKHLTPLPRFSIIIPTYNRASYLKEALGSVFSQTYKDYEVLVIDDGSTDHTKAMVHEHAPKVNYLHQKNQGRSSARNTGLRMAKGEIIAFLDSDDRWFPDKLARQALYLEKNPEKAMIHGHVEMIGSNGVFLPKLTAYIQNLWTESHQKGETYENWALQCCCFLSTVAVRRQVFDSIGLFDETIRANEELDLYLRIAARYKIGMLPLPPLVSYRLHPGNSGSNNLAQGAIQVANKHLNLLQSKPLPVNKAKALRNFQLSLSKSFFLLGDKSNGRKYFLKSCSSNPLTIFLWPYLRFFLTSLVPELFRKNLALVRQSFFPTPYEQFNRSAKHAEMAPESQNH